MGHIINAEAFRLGWFKLWLDSWYCNYIYYSEYLYSILRMRLFLIYFFSSRKFIKHGFLYSHFEIYNCNNIIFLNIYYYDCNLLQLCNSLLTAFSDVVSDYDQSKQRVKFRYIKFWRVFVFLSYLLNFFFKLRNYLAYYRLLFFIFSFKKIIIDKLFYNSRLVFTQPEIFHFDKKISFIMLFVVIFRCVYSSVLLVFRARSSLWNSVFLRFFYSISIFHWNYRLFKHFKVFFSYLFKLFTNFDKFEVNFYILSNRSLSASFISKYVVAQLSKGHDVKDILATLRLEFRQVRLHFGEVFPPYYVNKLFSKKLVTDSRKRHFFSEFVLNLVYFSNRQLWLYFKRTYTWILLESLFVSSWSYFSGSSLIFFVNFLILYSFNYIFLYFFFKNGYYFMEKLKGCLYNFNSYLGSLNFNFLFLVLFSNFNFAVFDYFFERINLSFLKLINFSLNRYLVYSYFYYSLIRNWPFVGLNFKDIRNTKFDIATSLLGFKMFCLGRFSRQQRVRKVYFCDYKLPLTKVCANIDYSFSVVPLINSAVSVKIWIYKKKSHPNFYFKCF